MLGDRKTVVLRGGAPWGFRLSGGGQTPVYIAKVRSRSKAASGGLAAGDTLVSVNGIPSVQQSLREINDVIDTVRDQLIIEVQCTTHSRGLRLDSSSSIDTRENSPVRSIHRITPQPKPMDFPQYSSARTTPSYPSFSTSTPINNAFDKSTSQTIHNEPRYLDSYGRSIVNPLPALFRAATITSNSPATPIATARVQQFTSRPTTSNSTYDTPRNYNGSMTSGYLSDTNDLRRSSISMRPSNATMISNSRLVVNQQQQQQQQQQQPSAAYNVKISSTSNEPNYYSDSEYVTSGPRYYKISRQLNTPRRPSNVVLPIRSVTSRAYEQYIPPPPPPPAQVAPPIDFYRPQPTTVRFPAPPKISLPTQDYRPTYRDTVNHELGAELLTSPMSNKKRYADSSFFPTPYNTYPTIADQKSMARKIASILEGGDPTQRGATKFEKQRQRAEKYAVEADADLYNGNNAYRPLRPLQTNDSFYSASPSPYYNASEVPNCIKHSLEEAQYINPLRYVGAPEEFKQMHMQEHVTHTNVPPQAAMNLVADLNSSRGKGAALFQKRKARSEKWIIDENNVKKQGYQPKNTYPAPTSNPWGQRAPPSWSDSEGSNFSPVRATFNPSPAPFIPEPIIPPVQAATVPRFGDFNAKPKGFGSWSPENNRTQSPRGSIDGRKPLNLNIEPSIREGIAESHTRGASQPWSPPYNPPNQPANNPYFNYPSDNLLPKWNQPASFAPMSHDGVDYLRQRLIQPSQVPFDQSFKPQRVSQTTRLNSFSSAQHFTDL